MNEKSVEIQVRIPCSVKDSESRWDSLEKHASNCPIPHGTSGYIFSSGVKDFHYCNLSLEDAEKVRIYWIDSFEDVRVDLVDDLGEPLEETPILDSSTIPIRGIE